MPVRFPLSQHNYMKQQMLAANQKNATPQVALGSQSVGGNQTGTSGQIAVSDQAIPGVAPTFGGVEDMLWGFELVPAPLITGSQLAPATIASALANLLIDPVYSIQLQTQFEVDPQFVRGPIMLTFQYGPFGKPDTWFVHGVEQTNIVSIRCPPLSIVNLGGEPTMSGASVEVHYLSDPYPTIAFAHFDPREANVDWDDVGPLLEDPTRFATLLNAQYRLVQSGDMQGTTSSPPGSGTTSPSSGNVTPAFSDATFTIGESFRFRYEFHHWDVPGTAPGSPADGPSSDPDPTTELQCVKFAGTYAAGPYSAMTNGQTLVLQIDEAWSMRWQGNPPPPARADQ